MTELNNNFCAEDDMVDVVEEDKTNMITPRENNVAISEETLAEKQIGETSPR